MGRQGFAAIDEERSMTDPQTTLFAEPSIPPCSKLRSCFYAKRVYLCDGSPVDSLEDRTEFTATTTGQTMQIRWNNSPMDLGSYFDGVIPDVSHYLLAARTDILISTVIVCFDNRTCRAIPC